MVSVVTTYLTSIYLGYSQEMASIVASKIEEEFLLINSNHPRDPHVANFILCRQLHCSVNIKIRSWRRLDVVARYEASADIIRETNSTIQRFRILLHRNKIPIFQQSNSELQK